LRLSRQAYPSTFLSFLAAVLKLMKWDGSPRRLNLWIKQSDWNFTVVISIST